MRTRRSTLLPAGIRTPATRRADAANEGIQDMASDFDIVIRGGAIMDGNGGTPFVADVAVKDGRIAEIGRIAARGEQEIDADGLSVTPGFVDIHTHYDGQAMWDSHLAPSSWHGVTTVVMGN